MSQDGTVSQTKYSVKYATGSLYLDHKFDTKASPMTPNFLSRKALMFSSEERKAHKSLPVGTISNKTSPFENKKQNLPEENSQGEADDDLFNEDSHRELPQSTTASLTNSFSSVDLETLHALSLEAGGETIKKPYLSNGSMLSEKALHLTWSEQQSIPLHQSKDLYPTASTIHESKNEVCLEKSEFQNNGKDGQRDQSNLQPKAGANICIISTPSQVVSSTSMVRVSNTVGDPKADQGSRRNMQRVYTNDETNPLTFSSEMITNESPRSIRINSSERKTGLKALSIFPLDKTATSTDEDNYGSKFFPTMGVKEKAGENDVSCRKEQNVLLQKNFMSYMTQRPITDISMFRPHTGPGHHNMRSMTGPTEQEPEGTLRRGISESQQSNTKERVRRSKKAKRDKNGRGRKKQDTFRKTTHGVDFWFDYVPEYEHCTQNRIERQQVTCSPKHGQQRAVDNSRAVKKSSFDKSVDFHRVLSSQCFAESKSIHGASLSNLTRRILPWSANNVSHTPKKVARLDKSQMQNDKILQHEKQKEKKQQQQQQNKKIHLTQNQLWNVRKEEQQMLHFQDHQKKNLPEQPQQQALLKEHHIKQHQHEHPLTEYKKLHCRKQSLQTASEPHIATRDRENMTIQPCPCTAPPLLKSQNTEREQNGTLDLERHVRNWVNSTH